MGVIVYIAFSYDFARGSCPAQTPKITWLPVTVVTTALRHFFRSLLVIFSMRFELVTLFQVSSTLQCVPDVAHFFFFFSVTVFSSSLIP
jgi:hypothetical protein